MTIIWIVVILATGFLLGFISAVRMYERGSK